MSRKRHDSALDLRGRRARLLRCVLAADTTSIDGGLPGDSTETPLSAILASPDTEPPDRVAFAVMELQALEDLLARIDEREARILSLRFGFSEDGPLTLREIGRRVGLSRERVRQIEKGALQELKEAMARVGFG